MLSLCRFLSNSITPVWGGTLVRLALQVKELQLREYKHLLTQGWDRKEELELGTETILYPDIFPCTSYRKYFSIQNSSWPISSFWYLSTKKEVSQSKLACLQAWALFFRLHFASIESGTRAPLSSQNQLWPCGFSVPIWWTLRRDAAWSLSPPAASGSGGCGREWMSGITKLGGLRLSLYGPEWQAEGSSFGRQHTIYRRQVPSEALTL